MDRADYFVGLDVGGSKIAGGVVAMPSGRVVARHVIPTRAARGGEAVLDDARRLAEELARAAPARIAGIGVAVAELVDLRGNVTSAHTIAWHGVPVRERFAATAPAVVEADVRAAALAEALFGAGRGHRLFVYVTLGTGISSCLVQDRRPFAGARGNALVMATARVTSTCPSCGAVADTVLEELASGPALVARYNARAGAAVGRAEHVITAAQAGDPVARDVVQTAGAALGNAVAFLANVLDPEAIVVGGGLGQAEGDYWDCFVDTTRQHIWADLTRELLIVRGDLANDAGFIGAAASAWCSTKDGTICIT